MSHDLTWSLPDDGIYLESVLDAAQRVAAGYAGVRASAEDEGEGCLTVRFDVPGSSRENTVEISIYDLGGDGTMLCLEEDAEDNHRAWEDASALAEELAEAMGGEMIQL